MPELNGAAKWLNSKSLSKKDVTGKKPTLIYFWSVSCETCKRAMPKMKELYNAYNGQLNVITVHMPRSEADQDLNEVRHAAKEYKISEPILVDNDHTLTNQFKNRYVPAYYLFDASGKLRHRHSGSGGLQILQKRISRILNETEK